jgi:hypothetical protein
MTDIIEIPYTPYRGESEPIIDSFEGKIFLHPKYFESVQHYTYSKLEDGVHRPATFKQAMMQIKSKISLCRSGWGHPEKLEETTPGVEVNDGESVLFRFRTNKEADKFYLTIKEWLLA